LASQGFAYDPGPVEPPGQSCGGSEELETTEDDVVVTAAGAEGEGVALTDVEDVAVLSSFEQAPTASAAATTITRTVSMAARWYSIARARGGLAALGPGLGTSR